MTWLYVAGSVASLLSLPITLYVLWREVRMAREVHVLKDEEEKWHDEKTNVAKRS